MTIQQLNYEEPLLDNHNENNDFDHQETTAHSSYFSSFCNNFLKKLCKCTLTSPVFTDHLFFRQLCLPWCSIDSNDNFSCCFCKMPYPITTICGFNKHSCDYTCWAIHNKHSILAHKRVTIVTGIVVALITSIVRMFYCLLMLLMLLLVPVIVYVIIMFIPIVLPIIAVILIVLCISKYYCNSVTFDTNSMEVFI